MPFFKLSSNFFGQILSCLTDFLLNLLQSSKESHDCDKCYAAQAGMHAISFEIKCCCRSLSLLYPSPHLLWLASPANLQSLMMLRAIKPVLALLRIKTLTGLTSLQLSKFGYQHHAEAKTICLPKLNRLHLERCAGVAEVLLQPGYLPSLEEFDLDDGTTYVPLKSSPGSQRSSGCT